LAFEVRFKKSVLKDVASLAKADQKRLFEAIGGELATDPYKGKALTGEFKGLYRWRVGNVRVVYEIEKGSASLLILRIGHRKDVYR
jgi:mRNA interferase RelE/StbE